MTVAYTRLSHDKFGDQLGVMRQRDDVTALANQLEWPAITYFYEDNDLSASPGRRPRPEFEMLLRDMRAGRVTHVLCYDQDRLVRDMRQLEDVVDAVEAGNVLLTSVNGDIDLLTDNGRMVARIKAAVARSEVEKLARRISRQKLQRAQRGFKNQGSRRTYGFTKQYDVVPEEAAILVELFRRKATGERTSSLSNWLNDARVPTTEGLIGRWTHPGVLTLLRRREYVGDITFRGEVVAVARFEAIIDRNIFEAVAQRLPTGLPTWRTIEEFGVLTGLMICETCHCKMMRGRGGTNARLYCCHGRQGSCGRTFLAADAADEAVLEAVRKKVEQIQANEAHPQADNTLAHALPQVTALQYEIDQAERLHARGDITRATCDTVIGYLYARVKDERSLLANDASSAAKDLGDWASWDLSARRERLRTIIQYIGVSKAPQPSRGNRIQLGRITVFFRDGDSWNLARDDLPTLRDVAAVVGCAAETASRALGGSPAVTEAMRQRVALAASDLGYVYHRRPRGPRTKPSVTAPATEVASA